MSSNNNRRNNRKRKHRSSSRNRKPNPAPPPPTMATTRPAIARKVSYVIGNTYERLSEHQAAFDRTGNYKKIHDWQLYVDILEGDASVISKVVFDLGPSFSPSTFTCTTPIRLPRNRGRTKWRFQTRQQTYGPITATVRLYGNGGSTLDNQYTVTLENGGFLSRNPRFFIENRPEEKQHMSKLNPQTQFGIELELTATREYGVSSIASFLDSKMRDTTVHAVTNYSEGRQQVDGWKLVPDGSIVCNRNNPDCTTFELVSPILKGGHGLQQTNNILQLLNQLNLKVNKSMGFHLHVDVSDLTHAQLVKVCQNWIKYESQFDSILPRSRRTGSPECDRYFKSNRDAMPQTTNKDRHLALENTRNIQELAALMNPEGRYYKLNLENLVTGRQPTLEFRQHSATIQYTKIANWVRLCTSFVQNSARLKSPSCFREGRSLEYGFDALFQYVIKDRALQKEYKARQEELSHNDNSTSVPCCSSCAHRGICQSVS